jgi:DNA replication and repair protein RecF
LLDELGPRFRERAFELGLDDGTLGYVGEPPSRDLLEARLDRDVDRGSTGAGPHLDDVRIASGPRELRSFGSQGEQRLAVLALLLAESELITHLRGDPPLLLLDDVLSELDPTRRRALLERVAGGGQALVTTASVGTLPVEPAQLVEVEPGRARVV